MAIVQRMVDAHLDERFGRITDLKKKIERLKEKLQVGKVPTGGDLDCVRDLRGSIRYERWNYEFARKTVGYFGFHARSERKRSKELTKRPPA